MGRLFLVEYNQIPSYECIHCRMCRIRVAFVQNYIGIVLNLVPEGIFNNMFNVEVPEDETYHRVVHGMTLADTYCVQCRMLLGFKLVAVSQPCKHSEGQFFMKLDKLSYWNDELLLNVYEEQAGGANEQNADQDGGDNEQNADQDGDANEQVPNEQDLGANEQNADQDGGANEQDGGANEQNADQDGNANEQVPNEQDLGANEQNADQDGGANEQDGVANEQNADQDGGANEQDGGANEQDGGANEQNADQDGDANEQVPNEQDLGTNEQNADQDEVANERVPNEDVDMADGMDNIDLNPDI